MCSARVLLNDERDGQWHRIDDLRVQLREGEKAITTVHDVGKYDEPTQGDAGIDCFGRDLVLLATVRTDEELETAIDQVEITGVAEVLDTLVDEINI
jgi:hypothetical protein